MRFEGKSTISRERIKFIEIVIVKDWPVDSFSGNCRFPLKPHKYNFYNDFGQLLARVEIAEIVTIAVPGFLQNTNMQYVTDSKSEHHSINYL